MKRFQKVRLSLPVTLLLAVLLSGAITVLALWCQPNALRAVAANLLSQPLLIVLNALPAGLLLLAFASLFRNVFFGAAVANLLVCGFSIANRIKIEVRDEPVFPRDLGLLKEVNSAMGAYAIRFPWGVIALVLAVTAALVILGLFVGCKPFPVKKLRGWAGRLLGAAGSLGLLVALILTVYASNPLYNSFKTSNPYYVPSVFNELGFPYCFCHHFTTYAVDKPAGFDRRTAEGWEAAEPDAETEPAPVSVIMVMNEAFSAVTDEAVFAWTEETDPLPNFHLLQENAHTVSTGRLIVPGFAGGTANTEFDVLTGIQTNALSATTTSSMRVVNRDLDSLFRVYGAAGYRTSYFHPGDDWFYNRENVMDWMGAEETKFIDEMPEVDSKGRWVTDTSLVPYITAEFEAAAAEGRPLFHYTTTIQNHMSYTPDKYGDGYTFSPVPLSIPVDGHAETLLKVYTEGLRDADDMLGQLWDYFAQREEPVVLVFFGDHLPYLGDNQHGYTQLGLTKAADWDTLGSYAVPYLIWANDAAAETPDWKNTVAGLDLKDGDVSAAFLGAAVLELTGHDAASPWFSFLNQLRRQAPVVQKQAMLLADGTLQTPYSSQEDSTLSAHIQKWRQWSYYKLKYQVFKS